MPVRTVLADLAIPSAARGAGTVVSGPIAGSGMATAILLAVHCTANSGTPTLDASLEESNDGSSWTAVTASSITQLTAAGNRLAVAAATKAYVRVTSVVAGTTPNMTYAAYVFILPD